MSLGLRISALAMATLCCCPPLSSWAYLEYVSRFRPTACSIPSRGLPPVGGGALVVDDQWLLDYLADLHARIERCRRVLEDGLDVAAHGPPFRPGRATVKVVSLEPHGTGGGTVHAQDCFAVVVLPQPLSPTGPRVASPYGERYAVDRPDRPPPARRTSPMLLAAGNCFVMSWTSRRGAAIVTTISTPTRAGSP